MRSPAFSVKVFAGIVWVGETPPAISRWSESGAETAGSSRYTPRVSNFCSRASRRRRKSALSPHDLSRKAARSLPAGFSSARKNNWRSAEPDTVSEGFLLSDVISLLLVRKPLPNHASGDSSFIERSLSGLVLLQLLSEPTAGIGPETVGGSGRDVQWLGGFRKSEPDEIAKLNQIVG